MEINKNNNRFKISNLMGAYKKRTQYTILGLLLLLFFILLVASFLTARDTITSKNFYVKNSVNSSNLFNMLRLEKNKLSIKNFENFNNISTTINQINIKNKSINRLTNELSRDSNIDLISLLSETNKKTQLINKNIEEIIKNQQSILKVRGSLIKSLDILNRHNAIIDNLLIDSKSAGFSKYEIAILLGLKNNSNKIIDNKMGLLNSFDIADTRLKLIETGTLNNIRLIAQPINSSNLEFSRLFKKQEFLVLVNLWKEAQNSIRVVLSHKKPIQLVAEKKKETDQIISIILDKNNDLIFNIQNATMVNNQISIWLLIVSLVIAITAFVVFLSIVAFEKSYLAKKESEKNELIQSAIWGLINSMGPLQNGDLTQQIDIHNPITGVIADSINSTTDSLRMLVKKIRDTSVIMKDKTNRMEDSSKGLINGSENQLQIYGRVSSLLLEIVEIIEKLALKATNASLTAKESSNLSIDVVNKILKATSSMNAINSHMSETVRLMHKVGESSKQISNIVGLITDIAEETSILALNASIQATKAGDSGLGFKVVSDSIKVLAEKATMATNKISALITAVQKDVSLVDFSIESTTKEIENGVRLSSEAEIVLNIIKGSSEQLTRSIVNMAEDAMGNIYKAREVDKEIEAVLDIIKANKIIVETAASNITEMTQIASELNQSVSSFIIEDIKK